jgi:hypothetical protein
MNLHRSLLTLLFILLFISSNSVWAQSTKRDDLIREIESLRSQLKVREDALLEPSTEDRESFAEFLGQKDTGLIRLLPREEYEDKKKLTINVGGAYFSFSRLTHEYGNVSDIILERGNLRVGFAGANYGMMANLGDIPLEDVRVDAPGVEMLASLSPPTLLPKARIEQRRSGEGIQVADILYRSSLPVVLNSTYILRSVSFDESDVLVAFRVVRKDTDGSLILAWKMLKKGDVPKLDWTAAEGQ